MVKDDKFYACLKFILESEGGDVDHKNDRGGATRKGVSQKAYNDIMREKGYKGKIKSVFELNDTEIEEFYYYQYKKYKVDKIENLNSRYIYFDALILQGPGQAARMAQKVCKIEEDGCFGKKSISMVNSMNQNEFQTDFTNLRREHFKEIVQKNPTQLVFLKGWNNRVDRTDTQRQNGIIEKQYNLYQNNRSSENNKNNYQTQNLGGIDCKIDLSALNRIKGVNKMCSRFLIESQENIILSDLATVLSVFHDSNLKEEDKDISFSLDPIIIPNKEEFNEQQKVCYPDVDVKRNIIQDTEFAKILFDADYLLKLMSLGVESDGKTPFKFPLELQQLGLNSVCSIKNQSEQKEVLWRFWLVPKQCFYTQVNDKYIIDEIQVACQARQQERINNKLYDKISQDFNDPQHQFANKFTQLYDKIAQHYSIFKRLKQLFKAVALGRWMYNNKIQINYQDIIKFSRKIDNSPKTIPILKYEKILNQNKTPIYYTEAEKRQEAREYLLKHGYPFDFESINSIVRQIPDVKGYKESTEVQYLSGGVNTHCQNMIQSKYDPKIDKFQNLDEIDISFLPQKKCSNCNRMIESHLLNLNQNQCSVHNELTCYLCLDLVTFQDLNIKSCILNNQTYIFHQACYNEYQEMKKRKDEDYLIQNASIQTPMSMEIKKDSSCDQLESIEKKVKLNQDKQSVQKNSQYDQDEKNLKR